MGKGRSVKVVDIFAGPGGLGEGFASYRPDGSVVRPFTIVLSAEKEPVAHRTLTLRAFYRRFESPEQVPEDYYRIVRGEIAPTDLKDEHASEWAEAEREALLLELGVESARLHEQIAARIDGDDPWVLVGGPPCQAYSLAGRSRNKGKKDYIAKDDKRHYLYREYLHILSKFAPAVFIMENVKGILTASIDGERIFPTILKDLHDPGLALGESSAATYDVYPLSADAAGGAYSPNEPLGDLSRFLVRAEDLGIPQARHRIILLGVRRDAGVAMPRPLKGKPLVSVGEVVRDLPKLRSALSKGDSVEAWEAAVEQQRRTVLKALAGKGYLADVADAVQEADFLYGASRTSTRKPDGRCTVPHADWYHDARLGMTLNHDSRGHMASDLGRYLYCAAFSKARNGRSPTTRRDEFPKALAPNHKNWDSGAFANRFRVQAPALPSATVVSHISKDGHYFIHPDLDQCRSYTVREAARAQTFPDNYFFAGTRTEQYVQVGNAVPPLLANMIAETVWDCLNK